MPKYIPNYSNSIVVNTKDMNKTPFIAPKDGILMGNADNYEVYTKIFVNNIPVFYVSPYNTSIYLPLKKGDVVSADRAFQGNNDLKFYNFN